jgi:hypothetical protein
MICGSRQSDFLQSDLFWYPLLVMLFDASADLGNFLVELLFKKIFAEIFSVLAVKLAFCCQIFKIIT